MALDATAKEANVRDSIKKYFVDSIHTAENVAIGFDRGMAAPQVRGQPRSITRWVIVNFGPLELGVLSEHLLMIYCCTVQDNEGFRLAHLRDLVMKYLIDTDQSDGMARITLYRSYENQAWENIGGMVIQDIIESPQYIADDETKYKVLTVTLRWAAKA